MCDDNVLIEGSECVCNAKSTNKNEEDDAHIVDYIKGEDYYIEQNEHLNAHGTDKAAHAENMNDYKETKEHIVSYGEDTGDSKDKDDDNSDFACSHDNKESIEKKLILKMDIDEEIIIKCDKVHMEIKEELNENIINENVKPIVDVFSEHRAIEFAENERFIDPAQPKIRVRQDLQNTSNSIVFLEHKNRMGKTKIKQKTPTKDSDIGPKNSDQLQPQNKDTHARETIVNEGGLLTDFETLFNRCTHCCQNFNDKDRYLEHVKVCLENLSNDSVPIVREFFNCSYCSENIKSTYEHVSAHMKLAHGLSTIMKKKPLNNVKKLKYQCPCCKERFTSKCELSKHRMIAHPLSCFNCHKRFSQYEELRAHKEEAHKVLPPPLTIRKCQFVDCNSDSRQHKMFSFPVTRASICKEWIARCGNDRLKDLPPERLRSSFTSSCCGRA